MDILKYIFGYPKISWILDIHNLIIENPKMNYGYPKLHPIFLISINQFLDIQKSVEYWISIIQFMDIQKWIMDILKYTLIIWISINQFLDIQKNSWLLDIHNSIFWISKNVF